MDGAPANPFRLLDPFTKRDRLFGRDADVALVVARIASARTTLLFAGTGVGKTSFLQAKLIPTLEQDYRILFFSGWSSDRPAADLRRRILETLELGRVDRPVGGRTAARTGLGSPKRAAPQGPVDPASLLDERRSMPPC